MNMHTKSVLVVEDEPLIRMLAADFLADAGYETMSASNADEAVRILETRGVDAVFSDIDMPGSMNGLTLANSIARRWPNIGVLLASGKDSPVGRPASAKAGFLRKPYSQRDVVEALRRLAA